MNEKICPVCGKSFIPARGHEWNQETCGNHKCSEHWCRAKKTEEEKHYKLVKQRKNYKTPLCEICGCVLERQVNSHKRLPSNRLHDSCVYLNCIDALIEGKTLSKTQLSRLRTRGYTLGSFKKDYKSGKFDELVDNRIDKI